VPFLIGVDASIVEGVPSPPAAPKTTITASKMTVKNQENKAIFEGTVVLTKGNLVVHSDVMVVFFKPAEPSGKSVDGQAAPALGKPEKAGTGRDDLPIMSNRSVSMIEATGRVLIEKEDGRATCRKAVYHGAEEKIVLTGEPVAWQKGTRVAGKKITMYLAEDRSIVEGGSHVLIQQEGGS
jgi:lipopolysaccharide export system protein LptA